MRAPTPMPPEDGDTRPAGTRFERLLDRSILRALAGLRSYERGQDYFETGCVDRLVVEGDTLHATVQGTHRYRVELRPGDRALEHSCSCPMGREEELPALVGEIRATHARKSNLIALLDRLQLEGAGEPG